MHHVLQILASKLWHAVWNLQCAQQCGSIGYRIPVPQETSSSTAPHRIWAISSEPIILQNSQKSLQCIGSYLGHLLQLEDKTWEFHVWPLCSCMWEQWEYTQVWLCTVYLVSTKMSQWLQREKERDWCVTHVVTTWCYVLTVIWLYRFGSDYCRLTSCCTECWSVTRLLSFYSVNYVNSQLCHPLICLCTPPVKTTFIKCFRNMKKHVVT